MNFSKVSDPRQQAVLFQALDDHCKQHGICASDEEHSEAARRIMSLFDSGMRRAADFRFLLAYR